MLLLIVIADPEIGEEIGEVIGKELVRKLTGNAAPRQWRLLEQDPLSLRTSWRRGCEFH